MSEKPSTGKTTTKLKTKKRRVVPKATNTVPGKPSKLSEAYALSIAAAIPQTIPQVSSRITMLLAAVGTSAVDSVLRLIHHYDCEQVLKECDVNGSTALHIASKRGDIKMMNKLLEYKTKLNIDALEKSIVGGLSSVHHACRGQFQDVLTALLRAGANPNIQANNDSGETPLHMCCRLGNVTCADILLKHGASKDSKDKYGNNPSFWAHNKQHDQMIRLLDLPPPKAPSPDEYLRLMMARNQFFRLPTIKPKKVLPKKPKKS